MFFPSRRRLVIGAAAAYSSLSISKTFASVPYPFPTRAIRWIVPFPAGGIADLLARLIGERLSAQSGHPVVIENRAGAGGSVGSEFAARSAPDGHTLLLMGAFNAINAAVYDKLTFDLSKDIQCVSGLMETYFVAVAHPGLPVRSIADLIAYTKRHPDRLNFASAGIGSPHHVIGELFNITTGIRMMHVSYRGTAPAVADVVAGHVQVMFDNVASSLPHIQAGSLRPLAVTSPARSALLPDVPTVAETVPGFDVTGWLGVGVPKGTPAPVVAWLGIQIRRALADAEVAARIVTFGGVAAPLTPEQLSDRLAADLTRWADVVARIGMKRLKPAE